MKIYYASGTLVQGEYKKSFKKIVEAENKQKAVIQINNHYKKYQVIYDQCHETTIMANL